MKIKRYILLLLLIPSLAWGFNLKLLDDYTGPSYDFRDDFSDTLAAGSVHGTLSTSGHTRTVVDTYATTELIASGTFEVCVGCDADDGDATDDFGTWSETRGDGLIEQTATAHSGSSAAKITSGVTFNSRVLQTITLLPSRSYTITFWTRGDGTNGGTYYFFNGADSHWLQSDGTTWAAGAYAFSTGVTDTSYTLVTRTFTTNKGICCTIFNL